MALFVDSLVDGAGELLHGVDKNLLALAIQLEALGKGVALAFHDPLASQNHVVQDLVLVYIHLAGGLVILLQDRFVLFVDFLVQRGLHNGLCGADYVPAHALQLLALQVILGSSELPVPLDFIHPCHDLPVEDVGEFGREGLHPGAIDR